MVQVERQLFTVDEYYKMADAGILQTSDHVELIRGEIIKMSPIRSPHAGIINYLVEKLITELNRKATVASQNPIRLDNHSEPESDLVVAHYRKDRYRSRHPRPADVYLVIEVADSSLEYDRQVKAPLYAKAGIVEYWIVNIPEQKIEIYRQLLNGKYTQRVTVSPGEVATCEAIEFSLEVGEIFS